MRDGGYCGLICERIGSCPPPCAAQRARFRFPATCASLLIQRPSVPSFPLFSPPHAGSAARSRVVRQPLLRTSRAAGVSPADLAIIASPRIFAEGTAATLWASVQPGTFLARQATIAENTLTYIAQTDGFQYDQYEVAIPFAKMHRCFSARAG